MTDIDLTAAIEAAKDALLESPALGCGCCAWPDDLYESREEQAATEAITAALPHILAQVDARVKPDREAVARAIHGVIVASAQTGRIDIEVHDSVPSIEFERTIADSVLALLPGKTEQEVREQVMAEILVAVETFEAETKRANTSGSGLSAAIATQAGASLAITLKRIARGGEQT